MRILLKPALATLLLFTLPAQAQEIGLWRATGQTARSITGDIALSADKLTLNFLAFPIARIRALTPDEITAAFNPDPGPAGTASLYRLDIPASQRLLKHNTLCGTEDTTWMATFVSGRTLQIAFFSSQKPPVFTPEALTNSTDLCGIYTYVK